MAETMVLGAPTLCSLSVHVRRVSGSIVGRPLEIAAIQKELTNARTRLSTLTLEGEPGIGKTRLLLAAADIAGAAGATVIAVTADEEIRGPFLLARSILASDEARDAASGTDAEEPLRRAVHAISGRDDPSLEGMPADQKLLRAFDLASMAVRALAALRPLAIMVDDLQWADEDSLRMLRYIVRTSANEPLFLLFDLRPEETALVNEVVTLLADMERMGVVRRMRVGRFSQVESTDFLHRILGGPVDGASAAAMHAQAEGVPYILEELAHAYRDQGLVQEIDGKWRLARNAERLVPSNVRTLIARRASRLPDQTKDVLAHAAVLGRTFSIRDLSALCAALGDIEARPAALADALTPAVTTGLLVEYPHDSAADYSFAHEQIRESSIATLSGPKRRAVHAAIVDLLTSSGDPPAASLPMIAHHALAAGQAERAARYSVTAARAALASRAPEEVMRLIEIALPAASAPADRIALLQLRDDALEMLRRSGERLEGLAELSALAEALADPALAMEATLRRANASRASEEYDRAADLARTVLASSGERGDVATELKAALELGQALLHASIGESYGPTASEVDLEGGARAYERALQLATGAGDEIAIAGAERELGIVASGRVRAWFVERVKAGEHIEVLTRVANGENVDDVIAETPIIEEVRSSMSHLQRAMEIYERLGDRRGAMSCVIALAYISWAPDIHMPGSAKRIEEIRRLASSMTGLTKESGKALENVQMLYGVHVYAQAKTFPDLAITRGKDAYEAAREIADRTIEFASAGGVALAYRDIGDTGEARVWLDRAAGVATNAPTHFRAQQLELWRGMVHATAGDAEAARTHLQRAIEMATASGKPPARCETLARFALELAPLAVSTGDAELGSAVESAANDVVALSATMPGRPPWSAQAYCALAQILDARGNHPDALAAARAALTTIQMAEREDLELQTLLPAARIALELGEPEEQQMVRGFLQLVLTIAAQRFLDEEIRIRWFTGPLGRQLTQLAGPVAAPEHDGEGPALPEEDVRLLNLLIQGATNAQIAAESGTSEDAIGVKLAELFAKLGATSRAEATAFALMGRLV